MNRLVDIALLGAATGFAVVLLACAARSQRPWGVYWGPWDGLVGVA